VKIELTKRAKKDLDALGRSQPQLFGKVVAKIEALGDDPDMGKALVGPLKALRSLRVGDYRIIYEKGKDAVVVLTVNHRREVYR
jgi:addiction module RelE/StbE family toxin